MSSQQFKEVWSSSKFHIYVCFIAYVQVRKLRLNDARGDRWSLELVKSSNSAVKRKISKTRDYHIKYSQRQMGPELIFVK